MRSEIPPTHQIPTTPIHPIRATAADDDGEPQVGNPAELENLDPLTRSEMNSLRTTETAHGNSWLST